jgi:hypothetical protein
VEYQATRDWRKIPVPVLRKFGLEMLDRFTQRGLATILKISSTAVSDC